ncbi:MAG: MBL fold metallo-hydrolase [Candidatus Wallbacteria bacterium]
MIFKGYSKAKYSSWLYYSPYHTLFDAGEGINTILEEKIVAINNILLSHGHTDHYTGLINILMTKFGHYYSTGEFADLYIYYPKEDKALIFFIDYIKKFYDLSKLTQFNINWIPVEHGCKYQFHTRLNTYLETFSVEHTKDVVSMGYNIVERRNKLRPEFSHLKPEEVKGKIDELGREAVLFVDDKRTITYCGDSINSPSCYFDNTDVLIHEATFLKDEDRCGQLHSTLREAVEKALAAKAKKVILFHISTRYKIDDIKSELAKIEKNGKLPLEIYYIAPGRIFEI